MHLHLPFGAIPEEPALSEVEWGGPAIALQTECLYKDISLKHA